MINSLDKKQLKVAVLLDKDIPTDHSFVQGTLENSLSKRNCHITFIGYKSNIESSKKDNVSFIYVQKGSANFFINKFHKLITFTKKVKESGPYDVLYTRNDPVYLILAWYLKTKNIIRLHFHQISHLHAFASSKKNMIYKIKTVGDLILRKKFLKYADRALLISDEMKVFLDQKWPAFSDKYIVFPMGIEVSEFEDIIPYNQKQLDVTYIGTLAKSRRVDIIIDAVKLYNDTYGPLKLHIWGQSHDKQDDIDLKAHTKKIGAENLVTFYGKVARKEVIENIKNTKIGMAAIPNTGLLKQISPTKLMEYLAAGCCVVATKGIRDQEDIVNEAYGNGHLIDFTAEDIAKAVHSILSDPANADALSQKGREYIFKKRSYTEMASRIWSEFDVLLK
ncbi:hypothetical protein CHU92_14675 [Flavobacterium cyanobacteriorum]|uniref:Glycosyl transferase family 1 domain-containing protein n=1 Tax=Flavobacterium cyanobacteriorum TaxID=2022802 RepID=A0A255YSE2_9FLAO|nr:glycosyltransferase family 4 protein [Flavobacterium cyanobacteriorum]OYQ32117.1 hypothetical protein CHU92_14675 [Flavobacterium cyanobacteriorum]